MELKGNKDVYLLDKNDKKNILSRSGKFGSVYKARRLSDSSLVILKQFNPHTVKDAKTLAHFKREAEFQFNTSNIASVIDFVETSSDYFLVREYIQGIDLKAFCTKHKRKVNLCFALKCALSLLDTLEILHSNGVVHCDIKPSNVLLKYNEKGEIDVENPQVVLIDLGLAKRKEESSVFNEKTPFSILNASPEQLLKHWDLVTENSDIYSTAILLYELITRVHPFANSHPEMIMHLQINQAIKKHKNIPEALFQLLLKATNKYQFPKPPNRYNRAEVHSKLAEAKRQRCQSVKEFKEALAKILNENLASKKRFWNWFGFTK